MTTPAKENEPAKTPPSIAKQSAVTYGAMLLIGLAVCALFHHNLLALTKWPSDKVVWRYWLSLAGLGIGILLGVQEICRQLFPSYSVYRKQMAKILGPLTLWQALYLGLFSAVAEELLFRGAVQPYLGIALTSMVLSLIHLNPEGLFSPLMLLSFIASLTLGVIFHFTQSLYPSAIIHLVTNYAFLLRHVWRKSQAIESQPVEPQKDDAQT